jgi:hypothetical protein
MPHGDGTGPTGQGPRTGSQDGFCSGNQAPGFMTGRRGCGRRRRRHGQGPAGRGAQRGLRDDARLTSLERALNDTQRRVTELVDALARADRGEKA